MEKEVSGFTCKNLDFAKSPFYRGYPDPGWLASPSGGSIPLPQACRHN